MCAVSSEHELYLDRLRAASTISSRFLAENVHRRPHECSLEQITFVGSNWSIESTGSISGVYTASSISGFCTADTIYIPSISGFDTADNPVLAVL